MNGIRNLSNQPFKKRLNQKHTFWKKCSKTQPFIYFVPYTSHKKSVFLKKVLKILQEIFKIEIDFFNKLSSIYKPYKV